MKYCLTSDKLGGSILFEYDQDSGMMVQTTIEFVLTEKAAQWLAVNFPMHVSLLEVMKDKIQGRIDLVADIPTFDQFWDRYANKNGKEKARTAWARLKDSDKVLAVSMIPRYKQSLPSWQSMLMGSTYLSEKRFIDHLKNAVHNDRKNS